MEPSGGHYTVDPGEVVRMPPMPPLPPYRKGPLIAILVGSVLVALVIGIAIGRASIEEPVAPGVPVEESERGRLKVASTPPESNVLLDGRFVGVAPLDNLDVDPGKHSIVIDLFGYQPYSGTIEVERRGNAKLTVSLAPLNTEGTSSGSVSGGGKATNMPVPRSALVGGGPAVAPAGGGGTQPKVTTSRPPPRASFPPPQRPRRDCSGENRTCRDGCYRADSDCRFSCPGCTSCLTSVGWDECKRQCDTCRNGCEQNKKFCESSCESQNRNCEAQNN